MQKWLKYTGIILLIPVLLFTVLVLLLYFPPVQNLLREKATGYLSTTLGKRVEVASIRLRFPLNLVVNDISITQAHDTLLYLHKLDAGVHLLPLFKGRVEVEGVTLQQGIIRSGDFLEGMEINGTIGKLHFNSDGIYLSEQIAGINKIALENTAIHLLLNDTTESAKDSTAAVKWQIRIEDLTLKQVAFAMELPQDTLSLSAFVSEGGTKEAVVLLETQQYSLEKLSVTNGSFRYDQGKTVQRKKGIDPSHLALNNINIQLDSIFYQGLNIRAEINEFSATERSGLSLTSAHGTLYTDQDQINIPQLTLNTAHSQVELSARVAWSAFASGDHGDMNANLKAYLGKQDLFLLADLPATFENSYPNHPLALEAVLQGNTENVVLPNLAARLPGAFELTASGSAQNILDNNTRNGNLTLSGTAINLNFLTTLGGTPQTPSFVIPQNIGLEGKMSASGADYTANLTFRERAGSVTVNGSYNTESERYQARLRVDSLQVDHFLPQDSIYTLTLLADAKGRGIDFNSPSTTAEVAAKVERLVYTDWEFYGIDLNANLSGGVVRAEAVSNNDLLKMNAQATYNLLTSYMDAQATVNVDDINFYKLGYIPRAQNRPFAFTAYAEAHRDTTLARLTAGDLQLDLKAGSGLETLINQATTFVNVLNQQIETRYLNHTALRTAMPTATLSVNAGNDNPVNRFLAYRHITFEALNIRVGTSPARGINGRATLYKLKKDSLQLDTIQFIAFQDTSRLNLRGRLINGPRNPNYTFTALITGELRNDDADLTVRYLNEKNETGIYLGVRAQPQDNGILINFLPDNPIIAFREFHFNQDNYLFLANDKKITANVEMLDDTGSGLRLHSTAGATTQQDLELELLSIDLAAISAPFPFLPEFGGSLSLNAHYLQSASDQQLTVEAEIDHFDYENQPIGNLALNASWLPAAAGSHLLEATLSYEKDEVLHGNLQYAPPADSINNHLNGTVTLNHFPIHIANVFIPAGIASLSGDVDGNLDVSGTTSDPVINGQLVMDSVAITSTLYGAYFRLDNDPLQITDNIINFNNFAIYARNDNPVTINGEVNFKDFSNTTTDLALNASNYELLNASRTRSSLVYGKAYIDLDATVKGAVDALRLRGNINVLGNTNATYVLADSPLTVQDRLNDVVTFVSFADTIYQPVEAEPTVNLGGLDMAMTIQIDQAVQLRADLTPDRESYVELEGGGDLSLQYSPQGDLSLSGRYTLSGGRLNYTLPVIPLKEFQVENGSYVEWTGDPMDPTLNIKAAERVRAQVTDESGQRTVSFDVSVSIRNRLDNMELVFDLEAPEDAAVQEQLTAMAAEERSRQAITMMATGIYLAGGGSIGDGLNMGSALNSLLQNEINNIAGSALKGANIAFDMESYDGSRTDYNFQYSQRFFNDRVQVVIGGKVSSGDTSETDDTFIDNISLEYRLDTSGTRYLRLFHDKNYESILEGEITETGAGLILRKKVARLKELFIFRRKKTKPVHADDDPLQSQL